MVSIDLPAAVNMAGGALMAALGLWVLSLTPRRATTVSFAVFAIGFGLGFVPSNVANILRVAIEPMYVLSAALWSMAVVAVVVLVSRFPQRLERKDLSTLGLPALYTAFVVLWTVLDLLVNRESYQSFGLFAIDAQVIQISIFSIMIGGLLFVVLLLPLRARDVADDRSAARAQYQLFAAGMIAYLGFNAGAGSFGENSIVFYRAWGELGDSVMIVNGLVLAGIGISAALWLRNAADRPGGTGSRNVALFSLAMPLVGMVSVAFVTVTGGHGVSRIIAVGILAYAILRHQLLGIDVKVKWTIKQSTVAAVFIAVFFIASEGAAALFEAQTGSTVAGILAAGALVFAITPLHRVAERVADRAMPGVKVVGEMSEDERVALYREQLRIAYVDGAVDTSERRLLQGARDQLGLTLETAERVEHDVVEGVG